MTASAPRGAARAPADTTLPTVTWMTPWYPLDDANLQNALSSPAAYASYLQEVTYLGQALSNLSAASWSTVSSNPEKIVMVHADQVGTFTLTGTPQIGDLPETARRRGAQAMTGDGSDNYLYEVNFLGAATGTQHNTSIYVGVASGALWTLSGVCALMVKYLPGLLNTIAQKVSAAFGNLVADEADAGLEAASEEAAEGAGVAVAEGIGLVTGVVGGVLALASCILELLSGDFQLQVSIINRSSTNYLILPNYYLQDGESELVAAADSCAYVAGNLTTQMPPTICTGGSNLYPFSACAQAFDGENVQATQYDLVYQHDGFSAPGVMMQLLECSYQAPGAGQSYPTLTPSEFNSGWTGLVINPHYHTDDAPNIALFAAGADLSQAEDWWDTYDDVTPESTGSYQAANTTLSWVLAQGDPYKDPQSGAWTWRVAVVITDNA